MSSGYQMNSRSGEQLRRYLPAIYRTRDGDDLAAYVDVFGELLDRIRNTLEQRLADSFPDVPEDDDARRCQAWIVPYLGDLVAARILSPEEDGQRAEVANAIRWRQRKGTLVSAEEIAEKVGQVEVELHEGWKRLAMTARVGLPLISATYFGLDGDLVEALRTEEEKSAADRNPLLMLLHPGVPAGTIDPRRASRAIRSEESEPLARSTKFDGVTASWKQNEPKGAPCFPGSFEDPTARTVDTRDPAWNRGHVHPRRLLVFFAPPRGIWRPENECPSSPTENASVRFAWDDRTLPEYRDFVREAESGGLTIIWNPTTRPVEITGSVPLGGAGPYRIEGLRFTGEVLVPTATIQLRRVEIGKIVVDASSEDETALTATGSLFDEVVAGSAPAVLERCTILSRGNFKALEATDCIFPDDLQLSTPERERGRFYSFSHSRVPTSALSTRQCEECVAAVPAFFSDDFTASDRAVLRPDTPVSITAGSTEGKEMGYFHDGRPWPARLEHLAPLTVPADSTYELADVIVEGTLEITGGVLQLRRAAVERLIVASADGSPAEPVLDARSCVFRAVEIPAGLARLEYCTLLGDGRFGALQASDCIFAGDIVGPDAALSSPEASLPASMCIRYSRVSPELAGRIQTAGRTLSEELAPGTNTTRSPVFHETTVGSRSVGVLHPETADAICTGSEDGGEMGAYHDEHHCLRAESVVRKLEDFLPVGIDPVLIPDERLLHIPPRHEPNEGSP